MTDRSSLLPTFEEFANQFNQYIPQNFSYSRSPLNMDYNFFNSPQNLFANPIFRESAPHIADTQMNNLEEDEEGEINESGCQTAASLTPEKLKILNEMFKNPHTNGSPHTSTKTHNPNKLASEIRANELRAKLLAMKGSTPHASNTSSEASKSRVNSLQVTSKISEIATGKDALTVEGRAAAAKEEASKNPKQRFPSAGTNTSSTISTSSMKHNDSTTRPIQASSFDVANNVVDEAAQYQKLQEVSARFESLNSSSKPVTPLSIKQMERLGSKREQTSIRNVNSSNAEGLVTLPSSNTQTETLNATENNEPVQDSTTLESAKPIPSTLVNREAAQDNTMEDIDQDRDVITSQDQHDYYDDLEDWLELTGYHDIEYRNRAISRLRKQKLLKAQLAELEREAQLEHTYAFRASSFMSEDVKPTRIVSMPPPSLPFAKTEDVPAASVKTVVPEKPNQQQDQAQTTQSRKRSLSPETYSATTPHSLKSTKTNDIPQDPRRSNSVNRGGARHPNPTYYNHNILQTPTSPYEPLERRISGYDDYDNRSRYDNYAPPRRGKPNNVPHHRDSRRGGKR